VPEATVLFADIVGFTRIAARSLAEPDGRSCSTKSSPTSISSPSRRGVEKVKTIGDSYMLVGGVPVPIADHAIRCADMALRDARGDRQIFNRRNQLRWTIRIGMHSAPLVAGIIGYQEIRLRSVGRHGQYRQPHGIPWPARQDSGLGGDPQAPRGQIRVHPRRRDREIKNSSPMPTYLLTRKDGK
jgi:hypothetical protein